LSHEPPLTGIRVLEVGNYMAAPFCCMQLADLGAEVIKIEHPDGGDPVRASGPFIEGEGTHFIRLNRNKKSIVIDLKSADGKRVFRQLISGADVFVENLRPGTMKDLGLDYERMREVNLRLIYVSLSGWGQDGPLSQLAGLDIMAQARGGLMSITGLPDGDPVKVGVPISDLTCGLYGALSVAAALQARHRTGRGQYIDVCLFESAVSLAIYEAGNYFATGAIPKPQGSAHQNSAPYQAVRGSDGWFTIGVPSPILWKAFCRALDLERLEQDPRFAERNLRFRNRDALIAEIEAVTSTKSTDHWLAVLEEAGVPCAPIQHFGQVFNDPQLLARDFFWDAPHPRAGQVRQLGSPMRLSDTPVRRERAAPMFGEHSEAVLRDAGFDEDEIQELLREGVIRSAS
jgi:formyl-CoA transferase